MTMIFESISQSAGPNWKLRIVGGAVVLAPVVLLVLILRMTSMPLRSYSGPIPSLSAKQIEVKDRLAAHVRSLSETVGERNLQRSGSLQATIDYLYDSLQQSGYAVSEHAYTVDGKEVKNIEATLTGTKSTAGVVIVGAHYDSVAGTVGANDNASGVAALLELARLFQGNKFSRSVHFVFFVNEEPPYFQTEQMGSLVYARQLKRNKIPVSAMISLETIGFYSDARDSQKYPALLGLFYPSRGNFIGFVGNPESRDLVRRVVRRFRESTNFPSEGIAAPADWPGVGWSDHWSFWEQDWPAIMITDTAPFRYRYYHTPFDTIDKINFEKAAIVLSGVQRIVESLANEQ